MKTHEIKCWPMFFGDVWSGAKTAEIRENDRGYEPGDRLNQHEYDAHEDRYSGRSVHQVITHVIRGPVFGLSSGWAVLSTVITGREEQGGESVRSLPAGNLDGIKDLDL